MILFLTNFEIRAEASIPLADGNLNILYTSLQAQKSIFMSLPHCALHCPDNAYRVQTLLFLGDFGPIILNKIFIKFKFVEQLRKLGTISW